MIGETRKIIFDVGLNPVWTTSPSGVDFPVCESMTSKIVEFTQKTDNPLDEAQQQLHRIMQGKSYTIYYWTWIKQDD